ncbi:TPA: hypothetical protein PC496_003790 [Clostridioides difficile]|nr:hypothetical protein [Clostridioides difficile]
MAYEKIKNMKIDIDNLKANITYASSNIHPIMYKKIELNQIIKNMRSIEELHEEEKFLFPIIELVYNGEFKLQKTVSIKIRYAFMKIKNAIKNILNKNGEYENRLQYSKDPYNHIIEIKDIVHQFKQYYNIKDKRIKPTIIFIVGKGKLSKIHNNKIYINSISSKTKIFTKYKELEMTQTEIYEKHGFQTITTNI